MTDELRSLLERLQRDGVDAGRHQAEAVLGEARREAERLLAEARSQAEATTAAARREAESIVARTQASLQHAARDLLLTLGQRIEDLLRRIIGERVGAALDGPTVVGLVNRLIESFVAHGRATGALDLVVGPEQKQALTDAVLHGLRDRLQHGVTLHVQPGVGRGFQIRMGDGGVTHDFTAEAIAAALADLVTPQIGAIVLAAAVEPAKRP